MSANKQLLRLVGHSVQKLETSGKNSALRFTLDDGSVVVLFTEGDCCSESWFADAINLYCLGAGSKIVAVREIPLPDIGPNPRSRQDVDKQYGIELQTETGPTTIVYRNSSNGYYGGELRDVEDDADLMKWIEEKEGGWSAIDINEYEWSA